MSPKAQTFTLSPTLFLFPPLTILDGASTVKGRRAEDCAEKKAFKRAEKQEEEQESLKLEAKKTLPYDPKKARRQNAWTKGWGRDRVARKFVDWDGINTCKRRKEQKDERPEKEGRREANVGI